MWAGCVCTVSGLVAIAPSLGLFAAPPWLVVRLAAVVGGFSCAVTKLSLVVTVYNRYVTQWFNRSGTVLTLGLLRSSSEMQ